jgi:hypothetical protein
MIDVLTGGLTACAKSVDSFDLHHIPQSVRQSLGHAHDSLEDFGFDVPNIDEVLLRDNQDVPPLDGVYTKELDDVLVLVDYAGWNLSLGYPAEDTVFHLIDWM